MSCDSTPDQGSVFRFTLDLPPHEAVASSPAPIAAGEAAESAAGYRVLVVDDNAVNRQVMELILDSAGVAHDSAADGAQGLEAMTRGDFDAVLMDLQMPVMDGLEATRRIRDWERTAGRPRAPILIVSANCLAEHIEAGRVAGADGHLNKPISAAALLGALDSQMAAVRRAA
jgi:CheY-like chemotaxis protein